MLPLVSFESGGFILGSYKVGPWIPLFFFLFLFLLLFFFYLPQNTNKNEIKQNSNTKQIKVVRKPKRNHGAYRYWAPSE